MPNSVPRRIRWAIDTLALRPTDRVLEVGCGTGAAASLVCERLTTGSLLAIDRSATAIRGARARNRDFVHAGRVAFLQTALDDAELVPKHFHVIFAFNVGSLRRAASSSLALLHTALRPRGRLFLFEQPPSAAMVDSVEAGYRAALANHGFTVHDVLREPMKPAPVVAVVARQVR